MDRILEYKCPRCGGAILYDTSARKMKCEYCDTEFEVDAVRQSQENLEKDDMRWSTQRNEWDDGNINIYVCTSCGGEIIADEVTAASECPYCSSPVIMKGNISGELKPDMIIPFALDKKAATEKFKQHLSGKKLLPKVFKTENKIEEIKGAYVPFWTYDADADISVSYKARRVHFWSDRNFNYTETSYYSVYREGSVGFENIPVDASRKTADDLMDSIEPFDFSKAVPFSSAYLSGFYADKYDATKEECSQRANARIKATTQDVFRSTVQGYSSVDEGRSSIRLRDGRIRYALLPVWFMNVSWNSKRYTFAMNGQTGKFVGDLPLDKGAYAKWFALITAIASGASGLLMFLAHTFLR